MRPDGALITTTRAKAPDAGNVRDNDRDSDERSHRLGYPVLTGWRGTIPGMLGVPVRLHDLTGEDLGLAHVPLPILHESRGN